MRIPKTKKKEEILMKKNFEINPSSFEDIFQLKTQSQQKKSKNQENKTLLNWFA